MQTRMMLLATYSEKVNLLLLKYKEGRQVKGNLKIAKLIDPGGFSRKIIF